MKKYMILAGWFFVTFHHSYDVSNFLNVLEQNEGRRAAQTAKVLPYPTGDEFQLPNFQIHYEATCPLITDEGGIVASRPKAGCE